MQFVYAFSTQPLKAMPLEELTAQPPNTTLNPFTAPALGRSQSNASDSKKRSFEEMERESNLQPGRTHILSIAPVAVSVLFAF